MENHINTYQGMTKDTGYDSIPNSLYIDAVDIRITTTKGESMGSWTNMKGNKEVFSIPVSGTFGDPAVSWTANVVGIPEVIGYTTIRNRIILFVADDSDTNGWIYDVQYNPATRDILPGFPTLKYYNANLGFSKNNPIEAIGRYESGCVQRIYWTDYNNYFRSINLEDPNLTTLPLGSVDIFPDVEYTQPLLKSVLLGGTLLAGLYQVAYKLRTSDGKETLISPPSNLIHITDDAESLGQSAQYNGALKGTNTNKAINVIIDTSNYSAFKEIDIFLIFHEDYNGTPEVKYIETKDIVNNSLEVTITGTEASFPIEFLEYTSKNYPFKTPKTITQKDNSLVIANTKSGTFSIKDRVAELGETFSTDVYRYLSDGTTTNSDKFNAEYNLDAQWDVDWHNLYQYKYQTDGITLGGESANISFKFHLEEMTVDGSTADGFANVANVPVESHDLDDITTLGYYNSTYPSNTSPFISGLLKGYKRGETYRFGLVCYNKKGEASFVEHIADIKFPDISEADGAVNASGTNYFPLSIGTGSTTVCYNLGIEFTFDFSTCPLFLAEIESYQIVRVQRTEIDKRRLTTGIFKTFTDVLIGNTAPNSFDFNLPHGFAAGRTTLHLYADSGVNKIATRFNLLESGTGTPYGDVVGDFVAYHSPEISYNFLNIPDLIRSTTNACILVTGAYIHGTGTNQPTVFLSGPENLCDAAEDYRLTVRTVQSLDSISPENIKRFASGLGYVQMTDTTTYLDNVIGPIPSGGTDYYLRNYYATFDSDVISGGPGEFGINNPQAGGDPASDTYEISKGATGIVGKFGKLLNNPIDQTLLTSPSSNYEYFDTVFVKPSVAALADAFPIADIVLPKTEIYGGLSEDALQTNIFIPASPVIDKSLLNPKVFGGDIFMTNFSFQSSSLELDTQFYTGSGTITPDAFGTSRVRSAVLPIESSINIELAYGSTLKTGVKYTEATNNSEFEVLRQETNNTDTSYGKSFKMYDHNTVYSRENYDVTFFVQPSGIGNCGQNDLRAYLSNVKINEEVVDSWTKYGANNFYDIDDYGPINRILNWKDNIFFYQDKAVGIYAINRAAITTTNDGVPTQLGTGLGFGKHQYISKENGSTHQWGIITTDSAIYSFDSIHRKIFAMTGQNNPLSEVKGMHSFLQLLPDAIFYRKENGGDNPILKKGVTFGKDVINDEVYMTFLNTGNFVILNTSTTYYPGDIVYSTSNGQYYIVVTQFTSNANKTLILSELISNSRTIVDTDNFKDYTIVYDELAQQFSTRLSHSPKIWISNGDMLITSNPASSRKTYVHNIGNWGEFYGTVQEASIKLVINPNADINKVLRLLEFNSIVRDNNKVIDRDKTITAFRVQTEYQDTGKILFNSSRIKRRFDKWRVKISRDTLSTNQRSRLRSTHFIVTLYFDNTENKEFIMNRLLSYYDIQIF